MRPRPPLTVEGVSKQLEGAGLAVIETCERSYVDSMERVRDWLSIPVFTEHLLATLTYAQRMDSLAKAWERVDRTRADPSRWMVFVASPAS